MSWPAQSLEYSQETKRSVRVDRRGSKFQITQILPDGIPSLSHFIMGRYDHLKNHMPVSELLISGTSSQLARTLLSPSCRHKAKALSGLVGWRPDLDLVRHDLSDEP